MQLLISLCISLQFYLQFLQFLLLHIARCMGTRSSLSPRLALSMLHVAYLVIHFSLSFCTRVYREAKEKSFGRKMWLKLIQMINQIKAATVCDAFSRAFGSFFCPPAISIIREIEEVCGCRRDMNLLLCHCYWSPQLLYFFFCFIYFPDESQSKFCTTSHALVHWWFYSVSRMIPVGFKKL